MHACPNCGYCPHCGRANPRPVTPWVQPHPYPQPYVYPTGPVWISQPTVVTWGGSNNQTPV